MLTVCMLHVITYQQLHCCMVQLGFSQGQLLDEIASPLAGRLSGYKSKGLVITPLVSFLYPQIALYHALGLYYYSFI